jgi:hypothetical protein
VGRSQAAAAQRAARLVASRHAQGVTGSLRPAAPVPRRTVPQSDRPVRPRPEPVHGRPAEAPQNLDASVGALLAVVVAVEIYLGVAVIGLDHGQLLLALGLSLDACSRVLGTVAAARAAAESWAFTCALGGGPFVAAFALYQPGGRVSTEPAPLAGVLGMVASCVLAVTIAASALGL